MNRVSKGPCTAYVLQVYLEKCKVSSAVFLFRFLWKQSQRAAKGICQVARSLRCEEVKMWDDSKEENSK